METADFLRRLSRHWVLVSVCTLVGLAFGVASAMVGGGGSEASPAAPRDAYVARRVVTFDGSAMAASPVAEFRTAEQLARLATTEAVDAPAAAKLGVTTRAVAGSVNTFTSPSINVVEYAAFAPQAATAERTVDAVVDALLTHVKDRSEAVIGQQQQAADTRLAALRDQAGALEGKLAGPGLAAADRDQLEAERSSIADAYRLVFDREQRLAELESGLPAFASAEPATVQRISAATFHDAISRAEAGDNHLVATTAAASSASSSTSALPLDSPLARGMLGALLGFVAAVGIVLVRDRMRARLHGHVEFEDAFGVPVLAEVPQLDRKQIRAPGVVSRSAPFSGVAEAHRLVRSSLLLLARTTPRPGTGAYVILVTSANPHEGKTTTVANLAATFAEGNLRVLAINCDFRRPALHRHFGVIPTAGAVVATDVPNVWLLTDVAVPAGASPTVIVDAQRAAVDANRDAFDVIVLDTAPMFVATDPLDVASVADVAVIVGRPGLTSRSDATRATDLLERHGIPLAGLVLAGGGLASGTYESYYSTQPSPTGAPTPAPTRRELREQRSRRGRRASRRRGELLPVE